MHITFAGSPKFSKNTLQELLKHGISVDLVLTAKDKPKGRGQKKKPTPLKSFAKKRKIKVVHKLDFNKTDLVLVSAYGKIISKEEINQPKHGFLNVHPSLLPKYRGPTPIQAAILNGDDKTGVTIIKMDEKIDHGPILKQKEATLTGKEYYKDLEKKLSKLGGKLLAETIIDLQKGNLSPRKQKHSKASHTNLLSKKDGKINWKDSAELIERKIRAYNPWPGVFSYSEDGKRIKFFKAKVQKQTDTGPFGDPGKIYLGTNKKIAVQTGEDFLLVEELQLEGEKKVKSEIFLEKHEDIIGTLLN